MQNKGTEGLEQEGFFQLFNYLYVIHEYFGIFIYKICRVFIF